MLINTEELRLVCRIAMLPICYPYLITWESNYHSHFAGKKRETKRFSNLPKVKPTIVERA